MNKLIAACTLALAPLAAYAGDYHHEGRHQPRHHHHEHAHQPEPQPCGHWEIRKYKVWHEGRWTCSYDACGRPIHVWQPGYYTWRTQRVWVEHEAPRARHARHNNHRRSARYR